VYQNEGKFKENIKFKNAVSFQLMGTELQTVMYAIS
jgi:hypothetical protein